MPARPIVGEIALTKPLEGAIVKVRITRAFRWRLWATRWLIWLAVWVSGGDVHIETES